ncbi:hypothetical protein BSG1_16630 [Bacillus sp. SG-1]|nr:hypothetical protein BSG1_16630 [Bacillus sp. SG-1]
MDNKANQPANDYFCAQTNDFAALFSAEAFYNSDKEIRTITLEELRGKWVVLFFYGSDFTFV